MSSTQLKMYELAGANPDLRFSPNCWKTRLALAHKGIEAERIPWRFVQKDVIAFSGQTVVPILVDGDVTIPDSWRIALYLEEKFPDAPSLFGGSSAIPLARLINAWVDNQLFPAMAQIIVKDIHACLDPGDQDYFRATREKRFGRSLEEITAERPAKIAALQPLLGPLRLLLKDQEYVSGAAPAYADYVVFSLFVWARSVSSAVILEEDDPVYAWREKLLDALNGLARTAPTFLTAA